jgi:endopolyphosphatase
VNKTLEWVAENVRDKIDFVIWTGDSARHDNDDEHPRSRDQVVSLNKFLVSKMAEVFGKHNGDENDEDPNNDFILPIVPNIGNNDILPHNILAKGPNDWTRTYSQVWRQFIPEVQKHQFEQGGWFYSEVIPHKLAVFSLNTMYFFGSNTLVEGCALHSEPGYEQMEWLRIQLQFMRERGMKAMLIGHVPPVRQDAKTSWDETCWQKYALWTRQYRDVIVSTHWGHFNFEHFMFQDFEQIDQDTKDGYMSYFHTDPVLGGGDVESKLSKNYWMQLRDEWSELPREPKAMSWLESLRSDRDFEAELADYYKKIGGEYAERFSTSFVSSSVVPNLFPTMRIFEYNIEGLDEEEIYSRPIPPPATGAISEMAKKDRKHYFKVPEGPSKSAPPGPAYSMQPLSLLKYTQYFANLTVINNDFVNVDDIEAAKWHEGKHKGKKPHERDHTPNPKKFKFQVLYDTAKDPIYRLKDLTVPSMIDLARRIGNFRPEKYVLDSDCHDDVDDEQEEEEDDDDIEGDFDVEKKKKHKKNKHKKGKKEHKHRKRNEAWYAFVARAFVNTMDLTELEENFGH